VCDGRVDCPFEDDEFDCKEGKSKQEKQTVNNKQLIVLPVSSVSKSPVEQITRVVKV
jgi:hypothetical protein